MVKNSGQSLFVSEIENFLPSIFISNLQRPCTFLRHIVLADLVYELSLVDGVATVVNPTENNEKNLPIVIENKYQLAQGYSGNFYDINTSLRGGILYPALDPSIFEIKFPNSDIKGKVLGDNLGVREQINSFFYIRRKRHNFISRQWQFKRWVG